MSARAIHIEPLAPPKPALGAACNGCGICCLSEPCPLGRLISLRRHGACAAVRRDGGATRYRCGLATLPLLGALTRRWIAAGQGCDSDATATVAWRFPAAGRLLSPPTGPAPDDTRAPAD